MRIILLLFICISFSCFGQNPLVKKITIDVENVSLEHVFNLLEKDYGLVIVYGIDNVPSSLRVTVKATQRTVLQVIDEICRQAQLTYHVVDNAIWLKYLPRQIPAKPKADPLPLDTAVLRKPSVVDSVEVRPGIRKVLPDSVRASDPAEIQSVIPKSSVPLASDSLQIQPSETPVRKAKARTGYGVFANYGFDFNHFRFAERPITFEEYSIEPSYSVGIGAYFVRKAKLYLSLGVGYATKNFSLRYHYQVLDPDDPFPIPDQTEVEATYMELPLTVGYIIRSGRRLDLCVAGGFYPSLLMLKTETTSYLNSDSKETTFFAEGNESTVYSATLGVILNYRIATRLGIFLEPEYLFFVKPINKAAMDSNSNLYRLKAGIQVSIQK